MKKISKEELTKILNKHELWLQGDVYNGKKANFNYTDLCYADFQYKNLRGASFVGANLEYANFNCANLCGADLNYANLSRANLYYANLHYTNLYYANLHRANLSFANLRYANLGNTNLFLADFFDADVSYAEIYGANPNGAKNFFLPIACPEKGEFIGFKKARGYIVELKIPVDALRCSATSRKCRCSKAVVLSITAICGENDGTTKVASDYDNNFIYTVGDTIEAKDFCEDRWNECSPGIHFFITREEAIKY